MYFTVDPCLPSTELNIKILHYPVIDNDAYFEPAGVWTIFCDFSVQDENGLTELDRVWNVAKCLCDEGILHKATCSTAGRNISKGLPQTRGIYCYISDFTDLDALTLSAVELRKRCLNFPYPLYLKTIKEYDHSKTVRYLCCVDGDLYTHVNYGWKLLKSICNNNN